MPSGSALWLSLSVCHSILHLIQACKNNICLDLSPGHGLDGRLTGHRVETWDVKVCAHTQGELEQSWALAGFGRPVRETHILSPGLRQDAGWELSPHP